MGKAIVKLKLTNLKDLFLKSAGARKAQPREVEVEALVDTGATRFYLKPSVIKKLGLERTDSVRSRTTKGDVTRYKYEPVRLECVHFTGQTNAGNNTSQVGFNASSLLKKH